MGKEGLVQAVLVLVMMAFGVWMGWWLRGEDWALDRIVTAEELVPRYSSLTVGSGDNWWKLALRAYPCGTYDTRMIVDAFKAANPELAKKEHIHPGDMVVVPVI